MVRPISVSFLDYMATVLGLRCRECSREYPAEPLHVCEFCFAPLEVVYDYERIAAEISRSSIAAGPRSMWRYAPLLPGGEDRVDLGAGMTPLVRANRLAAELGLRELWLKNDTANPTHSFKDRVVSVALTVAKGFGYSTVACASTGNLANAVAAHAAHAGLEAYIFIPADLEAGKVVATAIYGPNLIAVKGTYDDVNRLCSEIAGEFDWAFVNVNIRPYYAEGSKSLAFEIVEQFGWEAPDHVVVPIASGSLLTKIKRGLDEMVKVGLIDGHATQDLGRAGERLLAGSDRVQERHRPHPSGEAFDDRQVARHRQPGGRLLRGEGRSGYRRCDRGRFRCGGRRRDPAPRADRRHLRRDRGRRRHRDAPQAVRSRGRPAGRARRRAHHRATD